MFYYEFKEYMYDDSIEKTFHFFKTGLLILSPVTEIDKKYDPNGFEFKFNGGIVTVWNKNKILKCTRPVNLLRECENCFQIINEYGEPIGYVYN